MPDEPADKIDEAINAAADVERYVHFDFVNGRPVIKIKNVTAFEMFGIVGTLQQHAEIVSLMEQQRTAESGIVVPPPGTRIRN